MKDGRKNSAKDFAKDDFVLVSPFGAGHLHCYQLLNYWFTQTLARVVFSENTNLRHLIQSQTHNRDDGNIKSDSYLFLRVFIVSLLQVSRSDKTAVVEVGEDYLHHRAPDFKQSHVPMEEHPPLFFS